MNILDDLSDIEKKSRKKLYASFILFIAVITSVMMLCIFFNIQFTPLLENPTGLLLASAILLMTIRLCYTVTGLHLAIAISVGFILCIASCSLSFLIAQYFLGIEVSMLLWGVLSIFYIFFSILFTEIMWWMFGKH